MQLNVLVVCLPVLICTVCTVVIILHVEVATQVDYDGSMCAQAEAKRDKQRHQHISFQEADIEGTDFPNESFDAILCASALPYVQDIEHALQKFWRWLKQKGGVLSYNCPEVGI